MIKLMEIFDCMAESAEGYSKERDHKMRYGNDKCCVDSHEEAERSSFTDKQMKESGLRSKERC